MARSGVLFNIYSSMRSKSRARHSEGHIQPLVTLHWSISARLKCMQSAIVAHMNNYSCNQHVAIGEIDCRKSCRSLLAFAPSKSPSPFAKPVRIESNRCKCYGQHRLTIIGNNEAPIVWSLGDLVRFSPIFFCFLPPMPISLNVILLQLTLAL